MDDRKHEQNAELSTHDDTARCADRDARLLASVQADTVPLTALPAKSWRIAGAALHWATRDDYGMMRQLGLPPLPVNSH
jgi:hypothetical protein